MSTCNYCGGYSESTICPSCKRNENLAEQLSDNARRLANESLLDQERLHQAYINEQERLHNQAHINSIREKMLELSLLAVSDQKKARASSQILFESNSFIDNFTDLYNDLINSNFLSDCFFTLYFHRIIYDDSNWINDLDICDVDYLGSGMVYLYNFEDLPEYKKLPNSTEKLSKLRCLNYMYAKLCEMYYGNNYYGDDYEIREPVLKWFKRFKRGNKSEPELYNLLTHVLEFRRKIAIKFNEDHERNLREESLAQAAEQKKKNIKSLIENIFYGVIVVTIAIFLNPDFARPFVELTSWGTQAMIDKDVNREKSKDYSNTSKSNLDKQPQIYRISSDNQQSQFIVVSISDGDFLNVREQPNVRGKIVGKLRGGEIVKSSGQIERSGSNTWVYITKSGVSGWVNIRFLKKI
jgi:hypothetical protein